MADYFADTQAKIDASKADEQAKIDAAKANSDNLVAQY